VDVRDVAEATIHAVNRGKSGERYIVGGRYIDIATILTTLARITGVPAPTRHIPHALTMVVAAASETWARLTGGQALVTLDGVRTIHAKGSVDSAKAVRELGATFRPFDDTARDAVDWFRAHGYLS